MDIWLKTLKTETPQEGFELAITLAHKGVAYTQPDASIRDRLRPVYSEDADSLTAASQVVAINFQTVAAANNYWKEKAGGIAYFLQKTNLSAGHLPAERFWIKLILIP